MYSKKPTAMLIKNLEALLVGAARKKALKALVGRPGAVVTGVAGSSAAVMLAALPRPAGAPVVVVGENLDDAGYLFFDLTRIVGEEHVVFLPSGYRRDIKYGQVDAPNQILRTETLRRLAAGTADYLVTYPEAMAETVASQDELSSHTRHLAKGQEADMHGAGSLAARQRLQRGRLCLRAGAVLNPRLDIRHLCLLERTATAI